MRSRGKPHVHRSFYLEPPTLDKVYVWRWDCKVCDASSMSHPSWRHAVLDAMRHTWHLDHVGNDIRVNGTIYERMMSELSPVPLGRFLADPRNKH